MALRSVAESVEETDGLADSQGSGIAESIPDSAPPSVRSAQRLRFNVFQGGCGKCVSEWVSEYILQSLEFGHTDIHINVLGPTSTNVLPPFEVQVAKLVIIWKHYPHINISCSESYFEEWLNIFSAVSLRLKSVYKAISIEALSDINRPLREADPPRRAAPMMLTSGPTSSRRCRSMRPMDRAPASGAGSRSLSPTVAHRPSSRPCGWDCRHQNSCQRV